MARMIDDNGQMWKFHPLPDPPPPPPFTITQRDWDTLMLKLDKFTIGLMNTLEAIKLSVANLEAQLESADGSQFQCDFFPGYENGEQPEEVEQDA